MSRQQLNEDERTAILKNLDDFFPKDTDAEEDVCVIEHEVRSAIEDEGVVYISGTNPTNSQEED